MNEQKNDPKQQTIELADLLEKQFAIGARRTHAEATLAGHKARRERIRARFMGELAEVGTDVAEAKAELRAIESEFTEASGAIVRMKNHVALEENREMIQRVKDLEQHGPRDPLGRAIMNIFGGNGRGPSFGI
jgi:hypothetical protein